MCRIIVVAILMISRGEPMLLAGDEFLRTQHGNNNAWCQDTTSLTGLIGVWSTQSATCWSSCEV
jgi:glycogen operon protein